MYIWDPERMHPMRNFKVKADNTCDVCGASCEETLYERVRETNKNSEFVLGPWTAVGKELWSSGIGCC